jgi:hypothetical protein
MCEHTMSRWCSNQLSYAPNVNSRSIAGYWGVAKGGLQPLSGKERRRFAQKIAFLLHPSKLTLKT